MTYLAPRQGLFAIIILFSFCLQTLLLVLSTEQQLEKSRLQKGEQMVTQLINEASLSLQNRDQVSLSVIAGRYASEQDVAKLMIKDASEQTLTQLGNAPMQQGETIRQIATRGDAVIGSVMLTLKEPSKGEIVASQWPFVIGSMLLHLFLWLLYGYVARPTREQINALSHDIHEHYRRYYRPINGADDGLVQPQKSAQITLDELRATTQNFEATPPEPHLKPQADMLADDHANTQDNDVKKDRWAKFGFKKSGEQANQDTQNSQQNQTNKSATHHQSSSQHSNDADAPLNADGTLPPINKALNAYVQTQIKQQGVSSGNNGQPLHIDDDSAIDNRAMTDDITANEVSNQTESMTIMPAGSAVKSSVAKSASQITPTATNELPIALASNREVQTVDIRIIFDDDKFKLLNKLAPEAAEPYFTLCSQLLNQAIKELLKQPLLFGVSLQNLPKFNHGGSMVVLKADNSHAKVTLAGVMLAKLYLMLNKIIYEKHREISRFALPVKIGVSDDLLTRPMGQLLQNIVKGEEVIILYPKLGFKQIGNYVQVRSIPKPSSVYERESAFFDGANAQTMQRLIEVRNAVLAGASSDDDTDHGSSSTSLNSND